MEDPLQRTLAILGTLAAGILLLIGSVYICTRVAVRIFHRQSSEQKPAGPGNSAP